jgi:chaperonin cofactor prefoldin
MPTVDTLQTELRDLKRRLELTETRVTQLEGRFEFVSGQLRDIQLYMHAKFGDMEQRFDKIENRLDRLETGQTDIKREMSTMNAKIDALPRVLAEMLAKR